MIKQEYREWLRVPAAKLRPMTQGYFAFDLWMMVKDDNCAKLHQLLLGPYDLSRSTIPDRGGAL
jgi:hypothetical protein